MEEGNVHAQVQALLGQRSIVPANEWNGMVESFRAGFFGPGHKDLSFPVKLHMVVSCESLREDIFWTDEGQCFAINRDGYQRRIMFVFFDQHKLKSFQNVIKNYKFRTELSMGRFPIEAAHNFLVYSHPSFVRGNQGLSRSIRIPKSPSRGEGGALNESGNPNLLHQKVNINAF